MRINFNLNLPWQWDADNTTVRKFLKFHFCREKPISFWNHKNYIVEFYYHSWVEIFSFNLDLGLEVGDHAGPELEITLFGFNFKVGIYDIRHWDYANSSYRVQT